MGPQLLLSFLLSIVLAVVEAEDIVFLQQNYSATILNPTTGFSIAIPNSPFQFGTALLAPVWCGDVFNPKLIVINEAQVSVGDGRTFSAGAYGYLFSATTLSACSNANIASISVFIECVDGHPKLTFTGKLTTTKVNACAYGYATDCVQVQSTPPFGGVVYPDYANCSFATGGPTTSPTPPTTMSPTTSRPSSQPTIAFKTSPSNNAQAAQAMSWWLAPLVVLALINPIE